MPVSIRTLQHEGLTLRSDQNLHGWKADLAVAVFHHFRGVANSVYIADLFKADVLFPDTPKRTQRRDNMNRLYETPVQVGHLVFSVENTGSQDKIFGKTRRLVAREGALDDGLAPMPAPHRSQPPPTHYPPVHQPAPTYTPPAPSNPYVPQGEPPLASTVNDILEEIQADHEYLKGKLLWEGTLVPEVEEFFTRTINPWMRAIEANLYQVVQTLERLTNAEFKEVVTPEWDFKLSVKRMNREGDARAAAAREAASRTHEGDE